MTDTGDVGRAGRAGLFETGARIGRYTLIRPLARGGMAEVYLACDRREGELQVERLVALKRMLPHMAKDPRFVSMFVNEVRIVTTLDHPAITQVLDVGEVEGEPYLVMEYLHGRTLQALASETTERAVPIPLGCALAIVVSACAGLHYAHQRKDLAGTPLGIIHRDVSPSNLMVRYDGSVKLMDFGIAKLTGNSDTLATGHLRGKASYMSPEQVADRPIDGRSDIFSVGILLYEVTTGRRLFAADNPVAAAHKISQGRVPAPTSWQPGFPPALETIILRALAPAPEARFQTCEEMQIAIESYARNEQLDLSTVNLRRHMTQVYGDCPYPTAPPRIEALCAEPLPSDLQRPEAVAPGATRTFRRGTVIAAAAAALGAVAVVAVLAGERTTLPPTGDSVPGRADATVGGAQSDPARARRLLRRLNERDWDLAMPYGARRAARSELVGTPVGGEVDEPLQVALDLLQADGSPTPCATFAGALSRMELAPLGYFLPALVIARPPVETGEPSCRPLSQRLEAVRELVTAAQRRAGPAAPGAPVEEALD